MKDEMRYGLLDYYTGAIINEAPDGSDFILRSPEERERALKYAIKKGKQVRAIPAVNENMPRDMFTWFRCRRGSIWSGPSSRVDCVRLFLLATYISPDGVLMDAGRPMNVKACADACQLSRGVANELMNNLVNEGFVSKDKGVFSMDNRWFRRGNLPRKWAAQVDGWPAMTVRIYQDTFRQIYHNCDGNHVGRILYVLQLIPYLNIDLNYVCMYPWADSLLNTMPLTVHEAAKTIGVVSQHYKRFDDAILSKEFVMPDGSPIVSRVQLPGMPPEKRYLVFNPRLIYGGTDFGAVDALAKNC